MSYFAEIDANGIVQRVIVAKQSFIDSGAVGDPAMWVETDIEKSFRKNYASEGFVYDKDKNIFIEPKPHESWTLNKQEEKWFPPITKPKDGKKYLWDENTLSWVETALMDSSNI